MHNKSHIVRFFCLMIFLWLPISRKQANGFNHFSVCYVVNLFDNTTKTGGVKDG